jgi:uncharacterized protein YcbK (DUF882 family)
VSRRDFLKLSAGILAQSTLLLSPALVFGRATEQVERRLGFYHMTTGEQINPITYRVGDYYIPEVLSWFNVFFRDFHTGDVKTVNPALFDFLYATQQKVGFSDCITLLSAFRTETTNQHLVELGLAAKDSYHLEAGAVDFTFPGCSLKNTKNAALSLKAGGVGYYPSKKFLHIDTGPFRTWTS